MQEKQERFIILKKVKYGEADLIIQAIGADGSRSSFMARSALKSKKRFGGGILEPLHYVNFVFKENSDPTKMKVLSEASLIEDFKEIRTDYDRLELALYILNCISHVSMEGDVDSALLFNLTGHSLRAAKSAKNLKVLKLHFCLKLLFQQGVISFENWMSPFLRTNLSQSIELESDLNLIQITDSYLDSIDLLVQQYIKTADAEYG